MSQHNYLKYLIVLFTFFFSISSISIKTNATSDENSDSDSVTAATTFTSSQDDIPGDEAIIAQGKTLYESNCIACHQITTQNIVGPGLQDVHKKKPLEWIIRFVRNSQDVINSGDEYAIELFNEYNKVLMPAQDDFSDDDIISIVAYIKYQSEQAGDVATVSSATEDVEEEEEEEREETSTSESYFTVVMGLLFVLLLILVIVLLMIIPILKKKLIQKEGELSKVETYLVEQKFDLLAVLKSKVFIGITVLVFIGAVTYSGIMSLYDIGVHQGYAPEQPIAFSHKIHAGKYKIDCNYCHTGVRKSKNANIPSLNICMNCHSAIKTESPEIKKIYAAIENNKPIEWVRVHNLPDLAYFNHSQHVVVGGVACQTCHGPVEKMKVIRQHARLTMGWCVKCHRRTAVNAEGNAYYDKLLEIHKQKGTKKPMVVSDIGGINCVKCHY